MSGEILNIVTDFNNTLMSLAHNISSVCPKSLIAAHIKEIEKQIKRKENFTKFIDLFCIKALVYKEKIDQGDESFFMSKDYRNDLKDQNEIGIEHVISMKSVWSELKKENKEIVILTMQILCDLAQQYFTLVSKNLNM